MQRLPGDGVCCSSTTVLSDTIKVIVFVEIAAGGASMADGADVETRAAGPREREGGTPAAGPVPYPVARRGARGARPENGPQN